ncbi:MAG: hypothetical protein LUQ67_08130 [Methanomicrobiales archaeon]|nr:hypothetical protein [Methanomicrobiales archaeon]
MPEDRIPAYGDHRLGDVLGPNPPQRITVFIGELHMPGGSAVHDGTWKRKVFLKKDTIHQLYGFFPAGKVDNEKNLIVPRALRELR